MCQQCLHRYSPRRASRRAIITSTTMRAASVGLGMVVCSLPALTSAYNNGVSRTPPLGWNTWCTYGDCAQPFEPHPDPNHDICNAAEIVSVAEAMKANGMSAIGWEYINLDDCWTAPNRSSNGDIMADPARFPDGLVPVIDHIHSLGLKFGLYTSVGETTCNPRGHPIGTWPRHGSYGHYKEDTATFASWGVDYVKVDWCGSKEGHSAEELHTNFSKWLNATGRPIHLELCRGYTTGPGKLSSYVPKVAQSWRVAGDNQDDWADGTRRTIESFVNNSRLGGPYGWNYGDFLTTGGAGCSTVPPATAHGPYLHCPGQNLYEYRTQFSVYVVAASPLIVSTDIRNMTETMKQLLLNANVIALNQQTTAPGDVVGTIPGRDPCKPCTEHSGCQPCDEVQVWARDVSLNNAGGTMLGVAVAAVNFADVERTVDIPLSMIKPTWGTSTKVEVDDLWARSGSSYTGHITTTIKPHDTALLQLTQP